MSPASAPRLAARATEDVFDACMDVSRNGCENIVQTPCPRSRASLSLTSDHDLACGDGRLLVLGGQREADLVAPGFETREVECHRPRRHAVHVVRHLLPLYLYRREGRGEMEPLGRAPSPAFLDAVDLESDVEVLALRSDAV